MKAQWMEDTKYESSATKIVEHPLYQKIIASGESMVPFILNEVRNGSNHWYYALQKMTRYTPPNAEKLNFQELRLVWLEWSKQQSENIETV